MGSSCVSHKSVDARSPQMYPNLNPQNYSNSMPDNGILSQSPISLNPGNIIVPNQYYPQINTQVYQSPPAYINVSQPPNTQFYQQNQFYSSNLHQNYPQPQLLSNIQPYGIQNTQTYCVINQAGASQAYPGPVVIYRQINPEEKRRKPWPCFFWYCGSADASESGGGCEEQVDGEAEDYFGG